MDRTIRKTALSSINTISFYVCLSLCTSFILDSLISLRRFTWTHIDGKNALLILGCIFFASSISLIEREMPTKNRVLSLFMLSVAAGTLAPFRYVWPNIDIKYIILYSSLLLIGIYPIQARVKPLFLTFLAAHLTLCAWICQGINVQASKIVLILIILSLSILLVKIYRTDYPSIRKLAYPFSVMIILSSLDAIIDLKDHWATVADLIMILSTSSFPVILVLSRQLTSPKRLWISISGTLVAVFSILA